MPRINIARVFKDEKAEDIREPDITDEKGEVINRGEPFTLQKALFTAMSGHLKDDEKLTHKERFEHYRITQKIMGPTIPAPDFTTDEIATMKDRIARCYPGSWIMGQAWDMLDPPAPPAQDDAEAKTAAA